MKRTILLLAFCFLSHLLAAQFSFGIKGGANVASIAFSNSDYDTKPTIGFHLGAFGVYELAENMAIRPELYFSTEGNNWTFRSGEEGRIRSNLIRIPVLFQYRVTEKLVLEAGPQYNLLLSIRQSINEGEFEDIQEFYKPGVLGYAIGASYDLATLLQGLSAGIRYNGDFSSMNDISVGGETLNNSVIQLSFAYLLSK